MKRIFTLSLSLTLLTHTAFSQGSEHALDFDGASDYVELGNASLLSFENDETFTIECWIKTVDAGSTIYSKLSSVNAPNNGYEMRVDANGRIRALLINNWIAGDVIYCRSTAVVNDGSWHHVAYSYNGSRTEAGVQLYIDGVPQNHVVLLGMNSLSNSGTMVSGMGAAIASRAGGIAETYDGTIDELRVWNKVLTETELKENMCQELNGSEPNLVAYYRMNEGIDNSCSGGEDVCDLTGNGNHGTKF